MLSLFQLTTAAAASALMICAFSIVNEGKKDFVKYLIAGLIVAAMDFVVEYAGTSMGNWTYYESFYHIFGMIPIELVVLFFSGGIIARYFWLGGRRLKLSFENKEITYNHLLYIFILAAFLYQVRYFYLYHQTELLTIAIPVGLWGVLNIHKENLESSLILAMGVFLADFILEVLIISSGDYGYEKGFNIFIPFVYGLLLLGFFGLMEKMNKLDRFIESRFMHILIKKSVYERRKEIKRIKAMLQKVKLKSKNLVNYLKE